MRVEILIAELVHDGERIAQGALLDLEPAAAEALVAIGAARQVAEAAAPEPQPADPAPAPRARKRSE